MSMWCLRVFFVLRVFFFMTWRPPTSTLFPYTSLFRSCRRARQSNRLLGCQLSGKHSGNRDDLRSEEHTSELQSRGHLVCRLLLEKKNNEQEDETTRENIMRYPRLHRRPPDYKTCRSIT